MTAAHPDWGTDERPSDRLRSGLEQCGWLGRYPRRPQSPGRSYRLAKRALDLAAVAVTAPVWAPLYGLCAAAVKLDSPDAPVHFSQLRTGTDGQRFRLYKFRTMVPNAEGLKASLAHLNERAWPDFKITDDPRVTRVGKTLRRTSLDELPQLYNVVRGDLTLVGPRPWSRGLEHHEHWHLERYAAPAGLTGPWQITSRDADSFVERVRLDLAYVQRRNLLLDLEVLLRTVPAVLRRRGAA